MEMNSPMDGVRIFNGWPTGNGDNGGFGGGSWLALLFLIILFGGGNGWGNRGGMGMNMNTTAAIDEGMILQAVQGNRAAIDQLSTATNMGVDGINRGLAQLAVNLANNFGDVKSLPSDLFVLKAERIKNPLTVNARFYNRAEAALACYSGDLLIFLFTFG